MSIQNISISFLDLVPANIYIYNPNDPSDVYLNQSCLDFTGIDEDYKNNNIAAILGSIAHPDDYPNLISALEFFKETPTGVFTSFRRIKSKDGNWEWFLGNSKVMEYTTEGLPKLIFGIAIKVHDGQIKHESILKTLDQYKFIDEKGTLLSNLSKREKQVLKLMSEGKSGPEMAKELFISEETIKSHRKSIHHKLNIKDKLDINKVLLYLDV